MVYAILFLIVLFVYAGTYGTKEAHNKYLLAALMLILALVVGFGDMLGGYDRYIYAELFDDEANLVSSDISSFSLTNPLLISYHSEFAYVLWNILVAHITENRYIFILLSTFFIFFLAYKCIKDYVNDNYIFALLAFMAIWFFFSHTYLRQAMATVIAWYGYRFVVKRQPVRFFICAFIAYEFHNSAIVFFPLYFLPLKKFSEKKVILIMLVLFLFGVSGITSALYTLYGGDDATERNKGYNNDDTGGRLAYLIEVIVFLYFIFKRYKNIRTKKDIVFLNAALCFCGMLLFFFRSSNAGRQSWYFAMGFIYLFPLLYSKKKYIDNLNKVLVVLFFALYFRIIISWGGLLSPYKTFLTDGYRIEDPIIEQYEYDWNYEKNKFYREPFRLKLDKW